MSQFRNTSFLSHCGVRESCSLALIWIAQEFYLDWSVTETVFTEEGHYLIQCVPRRAVLVEEISTKEYKIDLTCLSRKIVIEQRTGLTSCFAASCNISLKVFIESCPRTGSRSLHPIWLSVAMRILNVSSGTGTRHVTILCILLPQTERLTRVAVAHGWGWTSFVIGIHGDALLPDVLNDVERKHSE